MLNLLSETEPRRPGHLGTLMWPKTNRRPSAFTLPAGKILNRLKDKGLAAYVIRSDTNYGWIKT